VISKPASPRLEDRNPPKKRLRTQVSAKQSKRKRAESKGKNKFSQSHLDEDEWSAEESEQDTDDANLIPREPRPVRKQRRIITNACQKDVDEDMPQDHDVAMSSPPPEMDGGSSEKSGM
jgi:phage repressor protein C with HTH and peptisase S24 domain